MIVNNIGVDYMVGNFTSSENKRAPRLRVNDPDEGLWRSWGIVPKSEASAGTVAHWSRLIHATIYNASHMASYDKPDEIAGLIRWFIEGRPSTAIIPNGHNAPGFYLHASKIPDGEPSPSDVANPQVPPAGPFDPTNTTPSPAVLG